MLNGVCLSAQNKTFFKRNSKVILSLFISAVFLILYFNFSDFLNLQVLKQSQADLKLWHEQNQGLAVFLYFVIYVSLTAISFPGAAILTIAAGFLFGIFWGVLIVSFASTIGATISFLLARYLFQSWVENHFRTVFLSLNQEFKKQGVFYLFSLRLIPLFPFFAVNALMGLTKIKAHHFYLVSQLGMLPGTILYVWAGVELSSLNQVSDILSFRMFLLFSTLGLFPWFVKYIFSQYQMSKIYKNYKKPKKYDYNLIVIGGGAAGLVSTSIAANVKAKVAIIEQHKMGGDCLNHGCVPSKALIHLSKQLPKLDYIDVQKQIQDIIAQIEPHDSPERFRSMGADVFLESAKLLSPWQVQLGNRILTAKNIVIATGSAPFVPSIPGLETIHYKTSDSLWDMTQLPGKLAILGAGVMGCELAQAFQRLGCEVTLIEKADRVLSKEDPKVSKIIFDQLTKEGVKIFLNTEAKRISGAQILICQQNEKTFEMEFGELLLALGRKPRIIGYGLEELGVEMDGKGFIRRNEFMQTNYPNIFVCGDVTSHLQLTHMAGHQAWYASVNALFGKFRKFKEDSSVIPRCIFTYPEVASVGLSLDDAQKLYPDCERTFFDMKNSDRAICDQAVNGFIEIITKRNSDQILGVTIVNERAGELIAEFALSMRWKLGLKKILATVHAYPTWADANKLAALQWQKNHIPHNILKLAEKFHAWQRS